MDDGARHVVWSLQVRVLEQREASHDYGPVKIKVSPEPGKQALGLKKHEPGVGGMTAKISRQEELIQRIGGKDDHRARIDVRHAGRDRG